MCDEQSHVDLLVLEVDLCLDLPLSAHINRAWSSLEFALLHKNI